MAKNILIIQQKMIGDVLASSILCEGLKRKYPNASIHYVVNSNTTAVIENHPYIDHVIEFTPRERASKISFFKFLIQLRKYRFDLVIDAYGKLESNLMSFFANAPKKVSYYKKYTQLLYSKTTDRKPLPLTIAGNAIENRLRLIMSEEEIAKTDLKPSIYVTLKEQQQAIALLKQHNIDQSKPIIMMSVLGSSLNKSLPFDTMSKLIDLVAKETQATLLFNYIPDQKEEAYKIYNNTLPVTKDQIKIDVFGKSLREFICLLSICDALIGNEGGAVNMAKALEVPTFTIFSPWIKKEAWNMYEDGVKNLSTHLADFEPDIFKNKDSYKQFKPRAFELYHRLTPTYILPVLTKYLATNNNFSKTGN